VKPGHHRYEPKDGAWDLALYCFINVNNIEVNVYDGLGISSCEAGDGDVVAKVLLCSSALLTCDVCSTPLTSVMNQPFQ
jgi:hypothetical protein